MVLVNEHNNDLLVEGHAGVEIAGVILQTVNQDLEELGEDTSGEVTGFLMEGEIDQRLDSLVDLSNVRHEGLLTINDDVVKETDGIGDSLNGGGINGDLDLTHIGSINSGDFDAIHIGIFRTGDDLLGLDINIQLAEIDEVGDHGVQELVLLGDIDILVDFRSTIQEAVKTFITERSLLNQVH